MYGLTEEAVRDAVHQHCDFSDPVTDGGAAPLPTDRGRQINEVVDVVQHLMQTDASSRDLQTHFEPQKTHAPSQGSFVEGQSREWFETVIAPRLRSLPFIVENDTWEFDLDPDDYNDDQLTEIQDDPMIEAEQKLNDLGVRSSRREDLLDAYAYLCARGTATSDELTDRMTRTGFSVEDLADELEALGAERTVDSPPDPSEIEIETYADVLQAAEDVDREPVTQWSV